MDCHAAALLAMTCIGIYTLYPPVMLLLVENGTGKSSELFRGIMFEGFEHGEEHEDALEQNGHGDGTGSLHLASGQTHKGSPGFAGLAPLAGEAPDKKTGVGRDQQPFEMAPPLSCSQRSSGCPACLSRLKKDSICQRK